MDERQSIYCYPGTDVLINKLNIRDPEKLAQFEAIVTKARLAQLEKEPVEGNFDLDHLKNIHKFIFKDIYPFAGEIRRENIAKDFFRFAPYQFIEPYAKELFQQLKKEKLLKGTTIYDFSERAAFYMAEINVLHPFREGNGRTQREFIRQLAKNAGYDLDWSKVDKAKILQASIRSKVDTKDLAEIIRDCIHQDGESEPAKVLLKDLLKQVEGMPSWKNKSMPSPEDLNKEVTKYRVVKDGKNHILQFELKGENQLRSLHMEKIPYSTKAKEQWLEQMEKGIQIKPELDRDLGR